MNYFLILVILGICGGAYYEHTQDQLQIDALHQQLDNRSGKGEQPTTETESATTTAPTAPNTMTALAPLSPASAPHSAPLVAVLPPSPSRSSAIDNAAAAATAAANSNSLGTIKTLDGRSFDDCRVLKVESDGITFNHADGITKILYPLLPPDIQKKFGYDPQKAVADSAAQVKFQQESQQANIPASNPTSNP